MATFESKPTMSVKMKVDMTAAGNVAQSGDTIASAKYYNLPGIAKTESVDSATAVFNAFWGDIAGATFDSQTAVRTIVEGVSE